MADPQALIWTSKGNVPEDSLKFEAIWDIQPAAYIKLVERWTDSSGEVVKESAHVYSLVGVTAEGSAAQLG